MLLQNMNYWYNIGLITFCGRLCLLFAASLSVQQHHNDQQYDPSYCTHGSDEPWLAHEPFHLVPCASSLYLSLHYTDLSTGRDRIFCWTEACSTPTQNNTSCVATDLFRKVNI